MRTRAWKGLTDERAEAWLARLFSRQGGLSTTSESMLDAGASSATEYWSTLWLMIECTGFSVIGSSLLRKRVPSVPEPQRVHGENGHDESGHIKPESTQPQSHEEEGIFNHRMIDSDG